MDDEQHALADAIAAAGVELERLEPVAVPVGPTLYVAHVARVRDALDALRDAVAATQRWPVAVGAGGGRGDIVAEMLDPDLGPREDPRDLVAKALTLDVDEWFRTIPEALGLSENDDWIPEAGVFEQDGFDESNPVPESRGRILLSATPTPWEVPAYLWFGGWNECPLPHEHVAVLRRWHERYGAEIELVEPDVLVLRVARAPAGEEEARAAAWEFFLYDTDAVYQGTETLGPLATAIAAARFWQFWWD